MSLASVLGRLAKALPVIVAAAPDVINAGKQVRKALRKSKKKPKLEEAPVAP
jgi:hypothetical protein